MALTRLELEYLKKKPMRTATEELAIHQAQQKSLDEATILASRLQTENEPIMVPVPAGFDEAIVVDEFTITNLDTAKMVLEFIDEVTPEIHEGDLSGTCLAIFRFLIKALEHPSDGDIPTPATLAVGTITPEEVGEALGKLGQEITVALSRANLFIE